MVCIEMETTNHSTLIPRRHHEVLLQPNIPQFREVYEVMSDILMLLMRK